MTILFQVYERRYFRKKDTVECVELNAKDLIKSFMKLSLLCRWSCYSCASLKINTIMKPLTFGGGCVQWLDYLSGEPAAVNQWVWYHLVNGLSSCTLFSVRQYSMMKISTENLIQSFQSQQTFKEFQRKNITEEDSH